MSSCLLIPKLDDNPFNLPVGINHVLWSGATRFALRAVTDGSPVINPGEVFLGFWESHLFIRFQCATNHLRARFTMPGSPVWEEEAVEVFLQPPGFYHTYYEIDLNPLNTLTQLVIKNNGASGDLRFYEGDKNWQCPGLLTRTYIDGQINKPGHCQSWLAELSIPLTSLVDNLSAASAPWRANFFRVDAAGRPFDYQSWIPTGEIDFHRMECFGRFNLG